MRNTVLLRGIVIAICLLLLVNTSGCGKHYDPENTTTVTPGESVEVDGNMKKIPYQVLIEEEAQRISPNAYNLELAVNKGLAQSKIYDKNYLEVQGAYLALMNHYLCEKVGLNTYQEKLDNSELKFPESKANVYKKAGAFGRANIYIRNNVYVERLSAEDLQLLQNSMHEDAVVLSDELLDMVQRTLQDVISVRYDDSENVFEAVYDIGAFQTNFAPSNALVLSISYEFEYDENGNIIDNDKEDKKAEYLEDLKSLIEQEMSEKLGFKVCVFF